MTSIKLDANVIQSKTRTMRNLGNGKFEIHVPLTRQEELTINAGVADACIVLTISKEQLIAWRN